MPKDIIINIINELGIEVINFDEFLRNKTKAAGLLLKDCACINLAFIKKLTVVTADKIWNTLNLSFNKVNQSI